MTLYELSFTFQASFRKFRIPWLQFNFYMHLASDKKFFQKSSASN